MSRDPYNTLQAGTRGVVSSGGRLTELPTVDRSPSREYINRGGGGGGGGAAVPGGRHAFDCETWHYVDYDLSLVVTLMTNNNNNT